MNHGISEVDSLAEEYEIFLLALNGIYLKSVSVGERSTLHSTKEVDGQSITIATNFLARFMQKVDIYIDSISVDASETLVESLDARREGIKTFVTNALIENVQQVQKQMRVGRKDYAKLLGNTHGGIGYLIQKKVAGIGFVLRDSIGRKYDALTFFKSAVKDFFYQSWVDMKLDQAKRSGRETFRVLYPDPSRDMVISIDPSIFTQELRSKIFHPNSHASVE